MRPVGMISDAHNHLQDERLDPSAISELERIGIGHAVVNGTREKDWPGVLQLAEKHAWVLPSIGLHPWFVRERSANWKEVLAAILASRKCGIGEIGLDRWIENPDREAQEEAFAHQLALAAQRNLPASIHCLKAWGRLLEMLQASDLPACGFLLHSYNGPVEMLPSFLDLGAYFSISGYFAHPRKDRQRETFRAVPIDRFLVETDAPDMLLPIDRDACQLHSSSGERLNHPANLPEVYRFAADLRGLDLERFAELVDENFRCLFRPLLG